MKKLFVLLAALMIFAPGAMAEEVPITERPGITASSEAEISEGFLRDVAEGDLQRGETISQAVLDDNGLPLSALEIASRENTRAYQCPWYTIYCFVGQQCDDYCGAPGAGACESGCCACLF